MAYPKKDKTTKLKPKARPELSELSELHRDAIFNHEDCKALFDEKIKAIKLPCSEHSRNLIDSFARLLPEISDNALNLSDVEGEYGQLVDLIEKPYKIGEEYPTHPGIFILMANLIRKIPAKQYCDSLEERLETYTSCTKVLKSVKALNEPVRDACMAEFYAAATEDQLADIRAIVKHHENPKGHGMPGNGMVPQFGR